ncbi:putative bifunctional diguanylate cyclase/phosphodiesterase [Denitromonas iodatirespirans]|uniref:EAL domain-containing protein n=1 Tax=Denitromonas iodatirespirans TaxID=2795389 RepID=A0A944DCQ6_DENI1|nr:EAL domain-containing protein [Denitromonas iodatirespirans]MBT0962068.1 EAL domain-containing protein [Denitromonas iodatirespirans]
MSENERPARLLVIDDDDVTRMLACAALEEAGFQVDEAADGEAGLLRFDRCSPDLVLLDVLMPGIDGFETCRRLRRQGVRVPVIMLTGLEDSASIEQAYDSGATDFIPKPINWTLLRHRVRYALRAADAVESLVRSERNLSAAQEIARIGSWEWDLDTDRFHRSDNYCALFGEHPDSFGTGLTALIERVHPADRDRVCKSLDGVCDGQRYALEYRILRADGKVSTAHEMAVPLCDANGRVVQVQGTLQDISDRIAAEQRIRQLAYFDDLTGLPNRVHFREALQSALQREQARGGHCAVVQINVDRFKRINEILGQDAADKVLQELALRLGAGQTGRVDDGLSPDRVDAPRMARLNADNFGLFIEGASGRAAIETELRQLIDRAGTPVHLDGQTLTVSFSVGMAFYPQHGDTAEALLKSAEMALGALRRRGENDAIQCYTEQMKVDALARLSMESALRKAFEGDQFALVYQPKVDADRGCVVGGEALVRWHHPTEGVVGPAAFIPLIEEMGLIGQLGQWVLTRACEDIARWCRDGVPLVPIAVNLSALQFGRQDLHESIRDTLAAHGVAPEMIELEVTESILMRDTRATAEVLEGLHGLGLSLAVDDFGTGYSSLAYLKRFAVDTLKIDRSFVQDCAGTGQDPAIVRAIIAMAQSLGMALVAEGVETEAQARVLQAHGCAVMQGYLFARPLAEADFRAALCDGLPGADRLCARVG